MKLERIIEKQRDKLLKLKCDIYYLEKIKNIFLNEAFQSYYDLFQVN